MRFRVKFLTILLAFFIMGLTVSAWAARDSGSKGMNATELAQLGADVAEINNLMSLHSWYHAASMNATELEEIWSKRDDIVWAQGTLAWVGQKAIKESYGVKVDKAGTKGAFVWHTISTPVVEVARDRKDDGE